jgi:hypothetical protein
VKRPLLPLVCTLLATSASAKESATFRYTPSPDEQRPVVVEASVGPKGSDFALRLRFNEIPWGEECKTRCANATLLLDTDGNPSTGLQLGRGAPENGADVAVIIQGAREYKEQGADTFLRVKVRQLSSDAHSVDDGDMLAEMDHRNDSERVQVDGKTVFVLVDASALPSAHKARVVYHPAGGKAVQASIKGTLTGNLGSRKGGKPEILVGHGGG